MKNDLYQTTTDRIIEALEKGPDAWKRCWKSTMPRNGVTGRHYAGINILLLWIAMEQGGYTSSDWMTYRQAQEAGGQVRKGEKGTHIILYKSLQVTEQDEAGEDVERTIPLIRGFTVFNRDQIDGLPEIEKAEGIEDIDAMVVATGAVIRRGDPAYIPGLDVVTMPGMEAFDCPENYYSTLFHELAHWTGHEKRLARDLTGRFGNEAYAAEELIAELSAAFLCAHAGIEGDLRHAGYIQSWLKVLRNDKRAIFTAAAQASKAAEYLRGFQESEQREAA